MPHLLIQNGDGKLRQIEIQGDRITVGRHPDSDLVLENDCVSIHHAEIVRQNGTARIRDLGSSNGTKLNGERVQEAPLNGGDTISFGPVEAKFVQVDVTREQTPSAKMVLRDLGAAIAETSRALWGRVKLVACLPALKRKNERRKQMPVSAGRFIGLRKRAPRSRKFGDILSGLEKLVTLLTTPGASNFTSPTRPTNPPADAKNRYTGLSGKGDPLPLAGWDTKKVMQDILRHLAKGRRSGLHSKDWTWQEINAGEVDANCTGTTFALKLVAKQLAEHIGLICTDFDIQFVASSPNNAPAYVELGESRQGVTAFIHIRDEVMEDDTALAAIIAHEICHALLLMIDYPNKKSERATDLCAITLGLGPLIRNGKTGGRNLGYLSTDEIRRAITLARELKGSA